MQRPEKRWASREPLWLSIRLYRNGAFDRYGLVSNFSLNGLFLLCHKRGLEVGQAVEIDFGQDFEGIEKHCRIAAKLVRINDEGVGASFCCYDNNHFVSIQKLLFAKQSMRKSKETGLIPKEHQVA